MNKRFGKNDLIFVVALLLILSVACAYFYMWNKAEGKYVEITVDGTSFGIYNLTEDKEIPISNEDGTVTNILRILEGEAKMIDATCPDKLCMHQSEISLSGENIVCLPNKVVCTVTGEEQEEGLDAIAMGIFHSALREVGE